ncbi:unnamed protein product [Prunus armeniaca]|uniref:Uncharacterized protein n=1 Tax=Prunus armeniaca TaxID=36596 RepID=A0A6J5YB30_PRUAR|nr:unnamed protein product [Prunus armeniaca]
MTHGLWCSRCGSRQPLHAKAKLKWATCGNKGAERIVRASGHKKVSKNGVSGGNYTVL